tara:strand:+ start:536 stop:1534 length:999 start_codon:yes stop_codon:yes gene_type:complete
VGAGLIQRMAATRGGSFFVGVDVGGTKILSGLFDRSLNLVAKRKIKTKASKGGDVVLERVELVVRELLKGQGVRLKQVESIGLGVPGVVKRGRVLNAYNVGWEDVPIKTVLARRLRVPVKVDNDCNLFTLGIHRVELKGKPRSMVGMFLGTGFGGGLILNGQLYRGHNFAAGEFGQMTIDKNGIKTAHSFRGSLESLASRTGIVRRLRRAVLEGETTLLQEELGAQLKGVRSRHLRQAIAARDPLVKRVVRHVAEDTGIGVAAVVSALGPEYVVLGGGVMEALQKTMLPIIRRTAEQAVLPGSMSGVKVVTSRLGDDGGICGAAVLARNGDG